MNCEITLKTISNNTKTLLACDCTKESAIEHLSNIDVPCVLYCYHDCDDFGDDCGDVCEVSLSIFGENTKDREILGGPSEFGYDAFSRTFTFNGTDWVENK